MHGLHANPHSLCASWRASEVSMHALRAKEKGGEMRGKGGEKARGRSHCHQPCLPANKATRILYASPHVCVCVSACGRAPVPAAAFSRDQWIASGSSDMVASIYPAERASLCATVYYRVAWPAGSPRQLFRDALVDAWAFDKSCPGHGFYMCG